MGKKKVAFGLLVILALFLAAVAWIFLFMAPLKRQIQTQKEQLTALETKIKQDIPESLIQSIGRQWSFQYFGNI